MQKPTVPEAHPPPTSMLMSLLMATGPRRWGMSVLQTVVGLAILTLLPEPGYGDPPLKIGSHLYQLHYPLRAMAVLAKLLLLARLFGLCLTPLGRPLPAPAFLEKSRLWSRWFGSEATQPLKAQPTQAWENFSWRNETFTLLMILFCTAIIRLVGISHYNPDGFPYGSDAHTFIENAQAIMAGEWEYYNRDKYPLYPLLSGWAAQWLEHDYVRGCQAISWLFMTLSAPALYLAVRLSLGPFTAISACVIFAVGGTFQYYANCTTLYGLFTGLTLMTAGSAAVAVFGNPRHISTLLGFLLTGAFISLGIFSDIKFVTIAIPIGGLVLLSVLRPRLSLKARGLGLFLLILPLWPTHAYLSANASFFTPLAHKIEFQEREVSRFMSATQNEHAPLGNLPDVGRVEPMPPLEKRLAFNLSTAKALVPNHWQTLLLLMGLGLAAPLFARHMGTLRWRLVGLSGSLFMGVLLSTSAGAFFLLFFTKYVVHVLPFVVALILHGAWLTTSWLTPVGAPPIVRSAMGAAITGVLAVMSMLSSDGLADPYSLNLATLEQQFLPIAHQSELKAFGSTRVLAGWIRDQAPKAGTVMLCGQPDLALYMPRNLLNRNTVQNPANMCRSILNSSRESGRLWVVDSHALNPVREAIVASPERFVLKHLMEMAPPPHPQFTEVYEEQAAANASH